MSMRHHLDAGERRGSDRFDLDCLLVAKAPQRGGEPERSRGKTINMSSKGLRFSSEKSFRPGQRLEVSIAWPARLDDGCRLKIVVVGRVVRSMESETAITIDKAEYRTMGAEGLVADGHATSQDRHTSA